jgi:hypothetical protein
MNDKTEKTHFRKAFNSPYLSSADIVDTVVLTISQVTLSGDQTKKTKDMFNTAFFVETEIRKGEKLKPMILNATNSRTMKDLTGSPFIDDWAGCKVTIYVDNHVRMMGETVDGLRISPVPPQGRKELAPNTQAWDNAIIAFKRDGNLEAVRKRMDVSEANEQLLIEQANAVS